MHFKLIAILANGQRYSGETLGAMLGISRSAVWKLVKKLASYGLDIEAVSGKGYRLVQSIELLEQQKIFSQLTHEVRTSIESLIIEPVLNSTNTTLRDLPISAQNTKANVCLAEYQTQGRGRRGRDWYAQFGQNICLSIRWHFATSWSHFEGLSLVVGILVSDVLKSLGMDGVGIKWPNDIYFARRKLAGILIEMSAEADGPGYVIIGIGLNFNMPSVDVSAIDQPWIDVVSILPEQNISRNTLVASLINTIIDVLRTGQPVRFSDYLEPWNRYDLAKNKSVTVKLGDRTLVGKALRVDETGALVVRVGQRIERFLSGDISLRVNS